MGSYRAYKGSIGVLLFKGPGAPADNVEAL